MAFRDEDGGTAMETSRTVAMILLGCFYHENAKAGFYLDLLEQRQ